MIKNDVISTQRDNKKKIDISKRGCKKTPLKEKSLRP